MMGVLGAIICMMAWWFCFDGAFKQGRAAEKGEINPAAQTFPGFWRSLLSVPMFVIGIALIVH